MIYSNLITVNGPNPDKEEPQNTVFAAFLYYFRLNYLPLIYLNHHKV